MSYHDNEDNNFEILNYRGRFKELLELSIRTEGVEGIYWQIASLFRLGRVTESLELLQKSSNEFENIYWKLKMLNIGSTIYRNLGNFERALEYANRCIELADTVQQHGCKGTAYSNIAEVYRIMGDIDRALENYHIGHSIYLKNNIENNLEVYLLNLGIAYRVKGNLSQAEQFLLQNYNIALERNNPQYITYSLVELIEVKVRVNHKIAKEYYELLVDQYRSHSSNKRIQLHYKYASAIIHKFSKRNRDKVKAELLFEDIINNNNIEIYYTLESIPHLIELLLFEYGTYKEKVVLDEIFMYINKLFEIGKKEKMHRLVIKSLIIQAQLAQIDGDIESANKLLEHSMAIAQENELSFLYEEIETVNIKMQGDLQAMQILLENNATFSERVKMSGMLEYLRNVQAIVLDDEFASFNGYAL